MAVRKVIHTISMDKSGSRAGAIPRPQEFSCPYPSPMLKLRDLPLIDATDENDRVEKNSQTFWMGRTDSTVFFQRSLNTRSQVSIGFHTNWYESRFNNLSYTVYISVGSGIHIYTFALCNEIILWQFWVQVFNCPKKLHVLYRKTFIFVIWVATLKRKSDKSAKYSRRCQINHLKCSVNV